MGATLLYYGWFAGRKFASLNLKQGFFLGATLLYYFVCRNRKDIYLKKPQSCRAELKKGGIEVTSASDPDRGGDWGEGDGEAVEPEAKPKQKPAELKAFLDAAQVSCSVLLAS